MLLGTKITRSNLMKAAWRIRREDGLAMGPALRCAWAWARRKGAAAQVVSADPYAAARARGIYSPRDTSQAAQKHFADLKRRMPGSGCGVTHGW